MDLAQSFQPAWVKESAAPAQLSRLVERYGEGDRPERSGNRRDGRGPDRDRRPARGPGGGNRQDGGKRPPGRRDDRRDGPRPDRRPERESRPAPSFTGWKIQFICDPRGVEGLAKQIKTGGKAYPLFDLARLVLEKSERYRVDFRRESGPSLFQVLSDGTVWLSENEAVAHVIAHQIEKFYRRERITVEAPKGAYSCIAECGMSGVLLGPPNHHDYQTKIRKLHAERFGNMPFEAYKNRIRMVKDEATIQKWKDEQTQQDEFYPASTPEGEEPLKLANLAEVERHFRQHHAVTEIVAAGDHVVVPGPAAANDSNSAVVEMVRTALDDLIKFPLPLAHVLGQELTARGLQIFKAHENITYISVARPKYLDRTANPVSEVLSGILEYLESNPAVPRADQWKAIVALTPLPEEGAEAKREASVAADISWLVHQGHVIDYAKRGLEAARKPVAAPRQTERKVKHGSRPAEPATPAKVEGDEAV